MDIGIFVAPQQLGATYEDQLRIAVVAEEEGFSAFVRSDHVMASPGMQPGTGPTEAWVTLGALARETRRIRLGTMVSPVTFRLPGMLAITVAQVDAMSGGRVVLGLGAGWYEEEHRAYGIPFRTSAERFERLEEQLAIVRGIWTTPPGQTFGFEGRWYTLVDCPALPRPVQQPHPPIVVGGYGMHRTPRVAARFADEFNASPPGPPEKAAEFFRRGREVCESIGRDPATLRLSITPTTVCGSDPKEVKRRLDRSGPYAEVVGTPDEVAEQLDAYRQSGATCAYLRLVDLHDLDQVALIGREVVPRLGRIDR